MILDLFAGPGGWDVGLALLGMEAVGLEHDATVCKTRAQAGLTTIRTDVSQFPLDRLKGKVKGLIASPPCQDWSKAGQLARRQGKTGWLVDEPVRYVAELHPQWIAQEQVPLAEEAFEAQAHQYEKEGYHVWVGRLRSERYGVPQTRTRAVLMAHCMRNHVHPPEPTHQKYVHGQPARDEDDLFGKTRAWISMAEALGWGIDRFGFPRRDDLGTSDDGYRERDWRSGEEPAFTLTEKARSWEVHGFVDTRCDPRDGTTQERGFEEPAPTVTTRSGRQWQLKDPHLRIRSSNLRPTSRPLDKPSLPVAFGHHAAGWEWGEGPLEVKPGWSESRPATTVMGDERIFPPGHKVNARDRQRLGEEQANERYEKRDGTNAIKVEPWEALVLQSFPSDYPLAGSRTSQFSQIGDAMPPFLAAAVVGELTQKPWKDTLERLIYPEEFE